VGDGSGTVITVRAPGTVIRGVTVRGSGPGPTGNPAAIRIEADDVTIEGVTVEDSYLGIAAESVASLRIVGNTVRGRSGAAIVGRGARRRARRDRRRRGRRRAAPHGPPLPGRRHLVARRRARARPRQPRRRHPRRDLRLVRRGRAARRQHGHRQPLRGALDVRVGPHPRREPLPRQHVRGGPDVPGAGAAAAQPHRGEPLAVDRLRGVAQGRDRGPGDREPCSSTTGWASTSTGLPAPTRRPGSWRTPWPATTSGSPPTPRRTPCSAPTASSTTVCRCCPRAASSDT
jgi:hypothetical protein